MDMLAIFLKEGGVFIYLILGVSAIGMAVIADRVIALVFKYSVNTSLLWMKIKKALEEGDPKKAGSFVAGASAPVARMFEAAIAKYGKSEREIQNSVDEISLEIIPVIEKRVPFLAMMANIATLLGLLGTIHGLIQAFQAVGNADPSQKAALLASGISIALYTTAFGLVVAIPLLITYSLLQSRAHRLIDEVDAFSVKIMNLLIHSGDRRNGGKDTDTQAS